MWLPLAYLLCAVLGFAFPDRPWRWPIALMIAQLPVMLATSGEIGSLMVIGMVLLLALSVPGMIAAGVGGAARRWVAR